jgi:hypothetical protein
MNIYLLGRDSVVRMQGKASVAYVEALKLVPMGYKIVKREQYLKCKRELIKAGVIMVNKRGVNRVEELGRSQ